jgi:hypothetical protein
LADESKPEMNPDSVRTEGEMVFEKYLELQQIPFAFEKEHASKSKRPDYTVEWEGRIVVFDVKDFDPPDKFSTGFGQFDPYTPIREKIDQGRDKFKQFKEYCCGLVLYNVGRPLILIENTDIMLGTMYGDAGFTFPVNLTTGVGDASKLKTAFLGRGKMVRPNWSQAQNTTLSAIITLVRIKPHFLQLLDLVGENPKRSIEESEAEVRSKIPNFDPDWEVPRVIVWHNAVARVPFPTSLFRGDYDTHFGIVRSENGTVEQDVTYEGQAVPDRLRLFKPHKTNQ